MERRRILLGTAVGLTGISGCLSSRDTTLERNDTQNSETKTQTDVRTDTLTATETPSPLPAGKVLGVHGRYNRDWANIATTVTQESLTAKQPPAIQLTVTNESDEDQIILGELDAPNQWQCDFGPTNPGLMLVPPRATVKRAASGCWVFSDLEWEEQVGSGVAKTTTLSPGESANLSYEVWWTEAIDSEVCIPAGTYEFVRIFQRRPEESDLYLDISLASD